VIDYYRNAGCQIAIDDYGSKANYIDRLELLAPDILKVDMSYIHRSEGSYYYREYMKALMSFAERVGIEVLYEGIETPEQLDICVASNGRFYQGFLLAKPQPSIQHAVVDHVAFIRSAERLIKVLQDISSNINDWHEQWDARMEHFLSEHGAEFATADIDHYLSKLCLEFSEFVRRVYLCNRHGDQLSHNIEVESGKIIWNDYRNKNWAWRGFFQESIIALDAGRKSYLTNIYRDVSTKEKIYTYVYQIRPDTYLFIDILMAFTKEDRVIKLGGGT
jgi:hypothetical protein